MEGYQSRDPIAEVVPSSVENVGIKHETWQAKKDGSSSSLSWWKSSLLAFTPPLPAGVTTQEDAAVNWGVDASHGDGHNRR